MITEIKENDKYAQQKMDALLEQEGILRDDNLDYSCGIFDDEYELLATGSCYKNTIRCTAVADAHRGEGLLNRILTHLMIIQAERGNSHTFVYTKPESAGFFSDLGFYEIVRTDRVVFMENRKNGLLEWVRGLDKGISEDPVPAEDEMELQPVSAIVMNANPFTKGHRYLVEKAAEESSIVHLFVLSEDADSLPFGVRSRLVREGTRDLANVVCHDSGDYIISSATFPGYFLKSEGETVRAQAEMDIKVFQLIAKELGITVRYAGDEPYSVTTGIYNDVMEKLLPEAGIEFRVLPRLRINGEPVSASMVRQAINEGDLERASELLPPSSIAYFKAEQNNGQRII